MAETAYRQSFALLSTRRYGTFVGASLLSNLGTWAQQVAEPWLLLGLGASSMLLGLDTFMQNAPVWALTLLGGMLADRADRRRIIGICQSLQMLCPASLVVLMLTGVIAPWMVILSSLIVGVTDALSMPSFQSIVPTIVERDKIPSALALNATQFNLSRILGPAVAGILMASFGLTACFGANTLSYLPFILVALWILPRRTAAQDNGSSEDNNLHAGFKEIGLDPYLRLGLVTVLATSFFCSPLIVFLPILIRDALQGTAVNFSAAVTAFGLGGLAGAFVLLGMSPSTDRRLLATASAALYGLVTVLASLDPWLKGLPALMLLGGVAMTFSNTSVNTLLQTNAPAALRGRTVSFYMLAMRGGLSLGGLMTGVTAHVFGVQKALFFNGVIAIALQLAIGWKWHGTAASASRNIAP